MINTGAAIWLLYVILVMAVRAESFGWAILAFVPLGLVVVGLFMTRVVLSDVSNNSVQPTADRKAASGG